MMGISKLPGATKKVRTWASSDGWILNHLAAFDRALARPRPVSADAGWLKAYGIKWQLGLHHLNVLSWPLHGEV